MFVTFAPPEEPNGNISSYTVLVYRQGQLEMTIDRLTVVQNENRTLTAVIDGLKGGYNYSIRVRISHTHRHNYTNTWFTTIIYG